MFKAIIEKFKSIFGKKETEIEYIYEEEAKMVNTTEEERDLIVDSIKNMVMNGQLVNSEEINEEGVE